MIIRFSHLIRFIRAAGLVLAVCLLSGHEVGAQTVTGVGDDAIPLPKGGWRFSLSGLWNDYTSEYRANGAGGLTRRPLYDRYTTTDAGTAQFPTLALAQSMLRQITGDSKYTLSLGTLEAQGAVRQSIAPIALDYGVSRRLSLRVVVPYAESRDATQFLLNRSGASTSLGLNPTYGSSGAAARATNGSLLTQIDAARTALNAEIVRCSAADASNCDAIRANPAGASALLDRALLLRTNFSTLYGTATAGGSPVVPVANSALHTAVLSALNTLRSDFTALGVTALTSTAAPTPASTIMGPGGGISRIAADSSFGVGYQRIGNTRRAGIGDIDLTATYLLIDTFGADQVRRLSENQHAIRSTVTGGWRFGVAGADRTDDAFDVPIGEGANALLVRSTTDLVWSRMLWLSATVRAAKPFSDQVAVIGPFREYAGIFAPVGVSQATRTLGIRYDIELAPRVAIGQFFGLSGAFLLRHWGEDKLLTDGVQPTIEGYREEITPSRSLRAVSVGATFSTLSSYVRGRSRFPAEVIFTHTEPIGASGGTVPAIATERLELRLFRGFPRR